MLHPPVPEKERRTNRPEPEAEHGEPLQRALRPTRCLKKKVAGQGEQRRNRAEKADHAGCHRSIAPAQRRIARPDKGAAERREIAFAVVSAKIEGCTF